MSNCSKPGCPNRAAVVLGYDYASRRALLIDPIDVELSPHLYWLCETCAEKLTAPRGWVLIDERSPVPQMSFGYSA
jgi:Protein of unknown function (DUF3499)